MLRLLPGPIGSALAGDLIVADLVLLPGLVLHDEQRLVSYHALSYCCGEPILRRRIKLNVEQLPITENLFLALQTLRRSDERIFLWVDAVFIHQNNEVEKSEQFVNMLDIYHKASQVDVWLGIEGQNTALAMNLLWLGDQDDAPVSQIDLTLDGVNDILTRPWFSRIWVEQEICAAKQLSAHCGFQSASGDFVARWKVTIEQLCKARSNVPQESVAKLRKYSQLLGSFHRATQGALVKKNHTDKPNQLLRESEFDGTSYDLDVTNVLRRCAGSKCLYPQDHIKVTI